MNAEQVNETIAAEAQAAVPMVEPTAEKNTVETKQPDKMGSQFAALSRREKDLRHKEAELRTKEEQVKASLTQMQELESLSADEILERVAKKKNATPEDLIKSYIAKATGAPSEEQALKESKDPAVQALLKKIEAQERANAELKTQLEARSKSEQELQEKASVQAVQNECLQSATLAWTDESDFPMFFEDQADLAKNVLNYCANKVSTYTQENGFPPDESDIAVLIKSAPKLMLDELLQSPRGQRIAGLKVKTVEPARGYKPKLSPNVAIVTPPSNNNKPVRTKLDHEERLSAAKRALG